LRVALQVDRKMTEQSSKQASPSVMPSSSPTLVRFYVEMNGTSVIVEDLETLVGPDVQWTLTDSSIPPVISKMVLSNIPSGTTIKYTHPVDGPTTWVCGGLAAKHELPGDSEVEIRSVVDTLTILSAAQSDENFNISIAVTTDPAVVENTKEFCPSSRVTSKS
jgi:hypothetical protein